MRVVVQRVKRASVRIGGELHSSIEAGLLILLGVHVNGIDQEGKQALLYPGGRT